MSDLHACHALDLDRSRVPDDPTPRVDTAGRALWVALRCVCPRHRTLATLTNRGRFATCTTPAADRRNLQEGRHRSTQLRLRRGLASRDAVTEGRCYGAAGLRELPRPTGPRTDILSGRVERPRQPGNPQGTPYEDRFVWVACSRSSDWAAARCSRLSHRSGLIRQLGRRLAVNELVYYYESFAHIKGFHPRPASERPRVDGFPHRPFSWSCNISRRDMYRRILLLDLCLGARTLGAVFVWTFSHNFADNGLHL